MIDCIFGVAHEQNIIHTQEVGTRFITTTTHAPICAIERCTLNGAKGGRGNYMRSWLIMYFQEMAFLSKTLSRAVFAKRIHLRSAVSCENIWGMKSSRAECQGVESYWRAVNSTDGDVHGEARSTLGRRGCGAICVVLLRTVPYDNFTRVLYNHRWTKCE